MTDVLAEVLWTEKYRPQHLEDVALEPATRQLLTEYISGGEIPHLLLIGPPGSGKTTVARILIGALDCQHIALNASADRGIDVVRERIGSFAGAMTMARWNVVFLDEADQMTADAQTAMRNTIEAYTERTRFILTANHGYKVIAAIQSRCEVLTFGRPPLQERFRVLSRVLGAEGIKVDDPRLALGYAEKYPDMRRMLFAACKAWLTTGKKSLPPAQAQDVATGDQLYTHLVQKNWTALRRLTASGDFDPQQGLRELFWAIPDEHPRAGFLRHVVGRGVHESGFTPDPIVLFLGCAAEAMEGL